MQINMDTNNSKIYKKSENGGLKSVNKWLPGTVVQALSAFRFYSELAIRASAQTTMKNILETIMPGQKLSSKY